MQDPPPPALEPTIKEQAGDPVRRRADGGDRLLHARPAARSVRRPARPGGCQHGPSGARRSPAPTASSGSGCALLAPGVPGYDRDLDTGDCPYGDPAEPPDLDAARVLIEQAGAGGRSGDRRRRPATPASRARDQGICRRSEGDRTAAAARGLRVVRPDRAADLGARVPGAAWLLRLGRRRRSVRGRAARAARPGPTELEVPGPTSGASSIVTSSHLPQSYVAVLGHPTRRHVLLGAHGPRQRGCPPGVRQRLLELAAQGGGVGPSPELLADAPSSVSRQTLTWLS